MPPTAPPPKPPVGPTPPPGAMPGKPGKSGKKRSQSPECSAAASQWNLLRSGKPTSMPARAIYAQLGKCRAMARPGGSDGQAGSVVPAGQSARGMLLRAHGELQAKLKPGMRLGAKGAAKLAEIQHQAVMEQAAEHRASKGTPASRAKRLAAKSERIAKREQNRSDANLSTHQDLAKRGIDSPTMLARGEHTGARASSARNRARRIRDLAVGLDGKKYPTPAAPTLADKAAAHRATKGSRAERIARLATRAQNQADNLARRSDLADDQAVPRYASALDRAVALKRAAIDRHMQANPAPTPEEQAQHKARQEAIDAAARVKKKAQAKVAQKIADRDAHEAAGLPVPGNAREAAQEAASKAKSAKSRPERGTPQRQAKAEWRRQQRAYRNAERERRKQAEPEADTSKLTPAAADAVQAAGKVKAKTRQPEKGTPEYRAKMNRLQARRARRNARREERKTGQDPTAHTNHEPGYLGELQTHLIEASPEKFQYKVGASAKTGSVGSLEGVQKWDPEMAGVVQVWKDPESGKTFVVNGHNRLDLAKKLGVKKVGVRFINAPDAKHARAVGALTNIAEGRGTSLDAGQFFRDTAINRDDLAGRGIPLKEKVADEGLKLSGLAEPLWQKTKIEGSIPVERAALIGGSGLSHTQQMAVHDLAEKHGITRNSHLADLIDDTRAAGVKKAETGSLFSDPEEESLAVHRTAVTSKIKDKLGKEKRLLGTVAKGQNAETLAKGGNEINAEESARLSKEADRALQTFDKLKRSSGPVARAISDATDKLSKAKGRDERKKIHNEAYESVLDAVRQELG